ncbi:MAG TPA: response regulator, partial [Desulfobacteraceae bacterium]|nr:response regulator [Desulfobacteraceae bacterium]
RMDLLVAINEAMGRTKGKSAKAVRERKKAVQPDYRPLRILLVEDHENNRMVIQAYLKDTPYKLDIAENGEIACQKFTSEQYDLVLMDMQMPVMDGYTATRWIRTWEGEHAREPAPIIALTAHALVEDAKKCFDAGCVGYISKPLKKQTLLEAIIQYTGPAPDSNISNHLESEEKDIKGHETKEDRITVNVDKAFKDFVPRFLEVTSQDIQTMGKSLEVGDFETLQRLGHSMKGSGVSFGFDTMSNIGKSIEQAAKERRIEEIRSSLTELSDYIGRVNVVFVEKGSP